MDFNKINAFLATAVGGLIFKWLAGTVKSIWAWLNKIHPEEQFLVDELGLKKYYIRLSYARYKINSKEYTKKQKNIIKTFGISVILTCAFLSSIFIYFLNTKPITWLEYSNKDTHQTAWLRPDMAKSPNKNAQWEITTDTCVNSHAMERIIEVTPEDKDTLCKLILDPGKRAEISKIIDKNFLAVMVALPIICLSLLFFLSLGIGVFIEININKKIAAHNKKESDKSYLYLT